MSNTAKKIISWDKSLSLRKKASNDGRTVVFTNGCFDIIHPGHVSLLEASKSMGDILIVGLNSDASVRRLKGAGRPLNRQKDRARVLAALEAVDAVVVFSQDTPLELLRVLRPDILVKGADYRESEIVGRELAAKVARVKLLAGKSTTGIIKKVKKVKNN